MNWLVTTGDETLYTKSFDHVFNSNRKQGRRNMQLAGFRRHLLHTPAMISTLLDGPMLVSPHHFTCIGSKTQ